MLVVISDLHLNDGTVCTSTDATAAELFFLELEDQIQAAGKREDGTYKPVEKLTILLLGDIFDFIRSERWLHDKTGNKVTVRPWDTVEEYSPIIEGICDDIITENQEFLSHFKKATSHGIHVKHPDGTTGMCPVEIFYMVGNHDWFPYVDSYFMEPTRQKLREAFGLRQTEFPWKIEEESIDAKYIHDICVNHRVYAQHGDQYDEFNYHKFLGRDKASVGDAIVIELITKFPIEVVKRIKEKYPNDVLSEEFLLAIEELDNVRPSTHTVIYLRNVIEKLARKRHKKIVREVFLECAKDIRSTPIFKEVRFKDFRPTMKLRALDYASQFTPTCVVRVVTNVIDLFTTAHEKAASKERYIKENICDYVIYGHTHDFVVEGIGARKKTSGDKHTIVPQIYINSATWRPVNIEIDSRRRFDGFPYFSQKTMTWVAFFKDGERKGRTYETWSGRLGLK